MSILLNFEIQSDITVEPLSTSDAKAAMKVEFSDDDAYIGTLCKNARLWLENYTGLILGVKTVKVTIELERAERYRLSGPVTGIVSVTDASGYCLQFVKYGDVIQVEQGGIVQITYQGGYSTVPADIMNDMKKIVAWNYQNRGIDLSNENTDLLDFPQLASEWYKRIVI